MRVKLASWEIGMRRNAKTSIITLLTDFGTKDHYVGAMKGVILSINPQCILIDITHEVHKQNIREGAFILANAFKYFPKGTIHLAVVDPGVGSERKPILIRTKNYFFIGPDNGIFTIAAIKDKIKRIIQLTNRKYFLSNISSTFHGRDIFAPVAGYLSLGIKPNVFGKEVDKWVKLDLREPGIKKNKLLGEIIYIDNFGNLVSNVDRGLFLKFIEGLSFIIKIKNRKISDIKNGYWEGKDGEVIALFGSGNYLEISVKNGSARRVLNAKTGDPIIVERVEL